MQGALEVNGHFYYGTHGGDQGSGGRCLQNPGGAQVDIARYAIFDQVNGNLLPDRVQFDTAMGVWSFAAIPGGLLVGGRLHLRQRDDERPPGPDVLPRDPLSRT